MPTWLKGVALASGGIATTYSVPCCPCGSSVGKPSSAASSKVTPTAVGWPFGSNVTHDRMAPLPSGLAVLAKVAGPAVGADLLVPAVSEKAGESVGRWRLI